MKALTVRLPDDLHRRAKLLSIERSESLNAVLTDLLRKWVEHYQEKK